jgi:hypothetical protein
MYTSIEGCGGYPTQEVCDMVAFNRYTSIEGCLYTIGDLE